MGELRCDHLAFDLLPVFEALNLARQALQLVGPPEKVLSAHALCRGLDVGGELTPPLRLEVSNDFPMCLEIDRSALGMKVGQAQHAVADNRIERPIDQDADPCLTGGL